MRKSSLYTENDTTALGRASLEEVILTLDEAKNNNQEGSYSDDFCKGLVKRAENLSPYFVTGFTDAEGSFMISFIKTKVRVGWNVVAVFQIELHKKDLELLNSIRAYFGEIGTIYKGGRDSVVFRVRSLERIITRIIPHFDNYPLITQKKADYVLFRRVVEIMQKKGHLTFEGLQEIVNIRASLNLGLTPKLKEIFPKTLPVARPKVANQMIPHPE